MNKSLKDNEIISELYSRDRKIAYIFEEKPSPLKYGIHIKDLPINKSLKDYLLKRGIKKLYEFQERAFKVINSGKDTVIVAGTGTGKTEAFFLPLLHRISSEEKLLKTKALLIYPTKALARDQKSRINEMISFKFGLRALVLDGDTPENERKKIYSYPPTILITNPDMIHFSLMNSSEFKRIISTVKYVVLDDIHVYSGVFGTHVAYVLRRLERFLKEKPQYIGTSATIGNPIELAKDLFNRDITLVTERAGKTNITYHIMVRPLTTSKLVEAIKLLKICLSHNKKTIIFADSHKSVELIHQIGKNYNIDIRVHRAGLRAKDRENIESGLKIGKIKAVAATPTLELGIDIGDLDCVILLNIPPSYTKYVQRIGRCGRKGQKSYVFIILGDDPISAYYERNPEEFFNRKYDPVAIDLQNDEIAGIQLLAMAKDSSIKIKELKRYLRNVADQLIKKGFLRKTKNYYIITRLGMRFLRSRSNLRGIGDVIKIFNEKRRIIGTREMPMAIKELFPGAIYLHGGREYIVLDFKPPYARVRKIYKIKFLTSALYYTLPEDFKEINSKEVYNIKATYGRLKVTDIVYGYVIKDIRSGEIIKEVNLDKDISYSFNTKGILLDFPINLDWNEIDNAKAFHAIEHVLISSAQTVVGASPTDMGGISFPSGQIYIYDSYPGGSGITRHLFSRLEKDFERALEIVKNCNCIDGCPKCIFSPYCGNNNKILSRKKALFILENIIKGNFRSLIKTEQAGKPLA